MYNPNSFTDIIVNYYEKCVPLVELIAATEAKAPKGAGFEPGTRALG